MVSHVTFAEGVSRHWVGSPRRATTIFHSRGCSSQSDSGGGCVHFLAETGRTPETRGAGIAFRFHLANNTSMNAERGRHFAIVAILCGELVLAGSASRQHCSCVDAGLERCGQCGPPVTQSCCHACSVDNRPCDNCLCSCECGSVDENLALLSRKTAEQNEAPHGIPNVAVLADMAGRSVFRRGTSDSTAISHNTRQSLLCVWLN